MVNKIKTQEERLATVVKDIENKEEYVQQVQFEMNQIDEINKRIKSELGLSSSETKCFETFHHFLQRKQSSLNSRHKKS